MALKKKATQEAHFQCHCARVFVWVEGSVATRVLWTYLCVIGGSRLYGLRGNGLTGAMQRTVAEDFWSFTDMPRSLGKKPASSATYAM